MITIQTTVDAPMEKVWEFWNKPEHISNWAFASPDWQAEAKENNLQTGGHFSTIMSAKDKSASFDFNGTYTNVIEHKIIEYIMEDARKVSITFETTPQGTVITETFDPENENPAEMQRAGWQAILDNFKKYTENK